LGWAGEAVAIGAAIPNDDGVSLKEYFSEIFREHTGATQRAFDAHRREHEMLQIAIGKAEQNVEKRLEGMNEFRQQLNTQASTFATKDELVPFSRFIDRFWGVIAGLLIANAIVTALVIKLLQK